MKVIQTFFEPSIYWCPIQQRLRSISKRTGLFRKLFVALSSTTSQWLPLPVCYLFFEGYFIISHAGNRSSEHHSWLWSDLSFERWHRCRVRFAHQSPSRYPVYLSFIGRWCWPYRISLAIIWSLLGNSPYAINPLMFPDLFHQVCTQA